MKINFKANRVLLKNFLQIQKIELDRLEAKAPRSVKDLKEISELANAIGVTERRISDNETISRL